MEKINKKMQNAYRTEQYFSVCFLPSHECSLDFLGYKKWILQLYAKIFIYLEIFFPGYEFLSSLSKLIFDREWNSRSLRSLCALGTVP